MHSTLLAAVSALGALSGGAEAASIGVDFGNATFPLVATDSAGAPGFEQTNWYAVSTLGTNIPLFDNTGAATTATLSLPLSGVMQTGISNPTAGADERLHRSYLRTTALGANYSFTLDNIPYASYSLLVYQLGTTSGQTTSITAGGTTYYLSNPLYSAPGYIDGEAGTPFLYTRATSTNSAAPTPLSNYVLFTGLSAASLTVDIDAISSSNGHVGGFQIIAVPEPGSAALLALGALGLLARRRVA